MPDNGACVNVHEANIGFDTIDLDIDFVSGEEFSFLVKVLVNKGIDADSGSLAVVGNLLVRNADVIKAFQSP